MGRRIKNTFRWRLLVIWIAATVLSVGFGTQLRADEHPEPNGSDWVQTNGPYGGEILAIYAAPKGVLFAGTEGAGIFRSTDRGNSWTPVNTGLHYEPGEGFTGVPALVQKGGTLYAGTRRTLYASTDSGNTWHHVSSFQEHESISGIVVIGDRIYVGTLNTGVWYSDDDGDSWLQVNDGFGPMSIRELSSIGTTLVAGTKGGVFRKRVDEDELTAINDDFIGHQVDSFAAMEGLLYVGGYIGNRAELFKSNDEGDSWFPITPKEMQHTVEALSVYGATLYAGTYGSGVFRSDDNGDTWTAVNDGLTDRTVSTLLVVNEDTVFAGTLEGGIFRTMDGGDSWVEVNTGLTNTSVGGLAVIGKTIYAGMSERFVYSVNGGESWQPAKFSSRPNEYLFSPLSVSEGELYVGAIRFAPRAEGGVVGGVFRLDNESNALVQVIVNRDLTGIQCLEIVGTTFYIGTQRDGIYKWEKDSDPWTTDLGLEGHFITALSVNGENVYAGTDGGEIYRSENAGKSWKLVNSTDMAGSSISGLKWVGSTLYASSWREGVIRSVNGGDSWTPINDGLDDRAVVTMATVGTELYVGTYGKGVFRWMADKRWWEPVGSLHLHQILSLAGLDGFLYAGTGAGGVYKIQIEK
ncbi:MAG: hypothetical protein OXL96_03210 [Candidatus Poribacteria bacterium]|nr:hypothetical protein [Candidatus Poribacteria bacterium]